MESLHDLYVQEDVEQIALSNEIPWDFYSNKTVLITGSTGLIGSILVFALACRNRMFNQNIKIKALVRNLEKAKALFSEILNSKNFEIVVADINSNLDKVGSIDFIIHTASMTSSKDFVERPIETIATAIYGTQNVLNLARSQNVQGMLYLSSLEVYGVPENKVLISEKDSGYIDCLQVRSSYSEGKRMVECLCASYASEYNVPVKVARLSQTFGAGVDYSDNRVFAQFARSVIEGHDIVLKTKGETLRNYCYTADAVCALLIILAKGNVGEAYNVANDSTAISIADMAKFVCENFSENKSNVVFDIAEDAMKLGYNPVVKICLDTNKLESLGYKPKYSLMQMFDRLIKSMKLKKK